MDKSFTNISRLYPSDKLGSRTLYPKLEACRNAEAVHQVQVSSAGPECSPLCELLSYDEMLEYLGSVVSWLFLPLLTSTDLGGSTLGSVGPAVSAEMEMLIASIDLGVSGDRHLIYR